MMQTNYSIACGLQALIHCRRYTEACTAAEQLQLGWDRQYLLAEVTTSSSCMTPTCHTQP